MKPLMKPLTLSEELDSIFEDIHYELDVEFIEIKVLIIRRLAEAEAKLAELRRLADAMAIAFDAYASEENGNTPDAVSAYRAAARKP